MQIHMQTGPGSGVVARRASQPRETAGQPVGHQVECRLLACAEFLAAGEGGVLKFVLPDVGARLGAFIQLPNRT